MPSRKRIPIGLSEEERGKAEDIMRWKGFKTLTSAIRHAVNEYWKRLAWERSEKDKDDEK